MRRNGETLNSWSRGSGWFTPSPGGEGSGWQGAEEAEFEFVDEKNRAPATHFWKTYRTNVVLFLLTVVSTYLAGTWFSGLRGGLWYCAAIMGVLTAHEMGHYLTCRFYRVPATLPYFIPMPINVFGTMGAVIRMRGRAGSRRSLFDIAAAGPIAGLLIALPATVWGLKLSQVVSAPRGVDGFLYLGDSLLFSFLSRSILGPLPDGMEVVLHPLAFAGWAGLFVTALNLLPVGQLDGGHIVYAILGRKSRWVSTAILAGLIGMTLYFRYWLWSLVIILIVIFGFRHPPPRDDFTPLDDHRRLVGFIMLAFFVISFTPFPFHF